ncbi:hypothetical protein [Carboxylicivirga mesophila]|nr:hypothetical protein [Carboxylicivirga mesophila]
MKTSKIILISFLSVVIAFLLSFMITIERPNHFNSNEQLETIESALSNIHVVLIQSGNSVNLRTDSIGKLQYTYEKDSAVGKPFEIVADTLILKSSASSKSRLSYNINVSNINTIINNGGSVNIDIQQDSIQITNLQQGQFQIQRSSAINFVQLTSHEKSRTIVSSKQIQELDAQISGATLIVNKPIERVKLTAKDKADVTLHKVNLLAAECDTSSRYRIY